jgi:Zn-dependent peptidase ImmA (M78 family)/transcriptional regulator with XRE-family HTH domain
MPTRQEALVKPELLTWARKSSRLDVALASKKIGISQERLQGWENGDHRPTIPQLRKMAEVYKRPVAVFYLSEPPAGFDAMHVHDFRRLPDGDEMGISPKLAFEIRRAEQRRVVALELTADMDRPGVPENVIALEDDPDQAARVVRELLGITVTQQFNWAGKYEAFKAWKDVIENLGVLVFQTDDVPLKEMRGTSINQVPYPVIILNGHDWPSGKIFSLIHELTHLLLKQSGICNLREEGPAKRTEVFCNHIAGAVLVPTDSLVKESTVQTHDLRLDWTDEEINALANKFSVSNEVILRRLVLVGYAPEAFYVKKREEYIKSYEEQREREKQRLKETGGHPPFFRMVIRNNGTRYTRIIIDAYHDDNITISDVSDFLEIKLKHLPAIEQEIYRLNSEVWQ